MQCFIYNVKAIPYFTLNDCCNCVVKERYILSDIFVINHKIVFSKRYNNERSFITATIYCHLNKTYNESNQSVRMNKSKLFLSQYLKSN